MTAPTTPAFDAPAFETTGLGRELAALYLRAPRGIKLGLDPVQNACIELGHPEEATPVAHVAGTNGKGSVSAMLERIERARGRRTGLYTSPHLCRFAERIRVDGEPIDDALLERCLGRALAIEPELTFFEATTVAAFLAFREQRVESRILEVGLGGRLDATNVVLRPSVTVITRIDFDHMDKLGFTLTEIAREKAGILKPGAPLVLGNVQGEAEAAILARAKEVGAPVTYALKDARATRVAARATLKLLGEHQRENATVAACAAMLLGATDAEIVHGLSHTEWPGRLETIHVKGDSFLQNVTGAAGASRAAERNDATFLLDCAHNPDGARALARYLASDPRPNVLVFGALLDKAWKEMLPLLAPLATHRVYVTPSGRAPAPPEEMRAMADGEIAENVPDALIRARANAEENGRIVICGSLYLVGEARSLLLGVPRDPPVAL